MSNATPILNPRSQLSGFRYWPYERLSWRQTIAKSGLPTDVQELIISVIRKSRLLRFEKIEVVDELIAHFIDGKAAGRSYAELIAHFGDAQTTASLIHHSKIRNRPIMYKVLQIFGWGLLAVVSSYVGVWAYFHSGTPSPTTDYVPQFNQYVANVDQNDCAWPIYRPAWTEFKFCEGGEFNKEFRDYFYILDEDELDKIGRPKRRRIRPGDEGWEAATKQLDQWQPLLDSFREGSKKPRLGLALYPKISDYPPEDFAALFPNSADQKERIPLQNSGSEPSDSDALLQDSIVMISLPHIQSFRSAARLLRFDTRYAIEQQDSERVKQNLITFYGLANHASDCNVLVGTLVGVAVAQMGFEELHVVLKEHPGLLSETQMAEIQDALENLHPRTWLRLDGERAMVHDMIQRVFTDDGNGNGRVTPAGLSIIGQAFSNHRKWSKDLPEFETIVDIAQKLSEPAILFTSASRQETVEMYDAMMDQFEEDLDKNLWEAELYDFDEFLLAKQPKYKMLNYVFPAVEQMRDALYRNMATQEAAIAAVAANRFRLIHNRWPESLDELVPEFVVEPPVDVINGEPIKIKTEDGKFTAYSVWHDGDDDGGVHTTYQYKIDNGEYSQPSPLEGYYVQFRVDDWKYEGDLVFWPPYSLE